MKKKELKNLAKKIAEAEINLQNAVTPKDKEEARNKIFELSSHVKSLDDIMALDEFIQDFIKEFS